MATGVATAGMATGGAGVADAAGAAAGVGVIARFVAGGGVDSAGATVVGAISGAAVALASLTGDVSGWTVSLLPDEVHADIARMAATVAKRVRLKGESARTSALRAISRCSVKRLS